MAFLFFSIVRRIATPAFRLGSRFFCGALLPFVLSAQVQHSSNVTDSLPAVRIDSTLDLATVIARALVVSPASFAADEAVRVARSGGRVATAEFFPTLTASSALLNSNVTSVPSLNGVPPSAYSAGIAASYELFTGGRRGADRGRAAADVGAAIATDQSQRFAVTFGAQSAFYATLRAGDLVEVARSGIAEARQSLRYAQDRVAAGTATRSDALRAQLQLTTSQQRFVAALDTLQAAAYSLGRIVGADGPVAGRRPASLDPRTLALSDSDIVRMVIESSPDVQSAAARQRANEASLRAARTQYIPDLRLSAGYNWANQSTIVSAIRPGWSVLLSSSYPLFNGYKREDEITRADAAALVARVTTLDLTRQARTDASRLLNGLHFASANIALANEGVQAAAEDLRVQSERYRAGISTELDQLTSQLALTQAETALVAARYAWQLTRAQLEALIGRTL